MEKTTFIGLVRDAFAAGLGLYVLFGGEFTAEQIAGILTFVATALALATFVFQSVKRNR